MMPFAPRSVPPRLLAPALACAFLAAAAVAACSSSSSPAAPAPGTDGGASTDGTAPPDDAAGPGGEAGSPAAITCGAAPYVSLGLVVRQVASGGVDGAPIEGAVLTSSLCPGVSATSGADGAIAAKITKSTPFFARFEATNYATTLIAEMTYDADQSGINAPLPPSLFAAIVPGFGPTKTAIIVGVSKDGGTGACDALDGVSFSVQDHPEAKVTYYTNDAIPQTTTGTSTTVAGRAAITELAPGAPVTLVATKPGCTVAFVHPPYTGRAPLEAGALTLVPAYIR